MFHSFIIATFTKYEAPQSIDTIWARLQYEGRCTVKASCARDWGAGGFCKHSRFQPLNDCGRDEGFLPGVSRNGLRNPTWGDSASQKRWKGLAGNCPEASGVPNQRAAGEVPRQDFRQFVGCGVSNFPGCRRSCRAETLRKASVPTPTAPPNLPGAYPRPKGHMTDFPPPRFEVTRVHVSQHAPVSPQKLKYTSQTHTTCCACT
jgi:hypothetical protein